MINIMDIRVLMVAEIVLLIIPLQPAHGMFRKEAAKKRTQSYQPTSSADNSWHNERGYNGNNWNRNTRYQNHRQQSNPLLESTPRTAFKNVEEGPEQVIIPPDKTVPSYDYAPSTHTTETYRQPKYRSSAVKKHRYPIDRQSATRYPTSTQASVSVQKSPQASISVQKKSPQARRRYRGGKKGRRTPKGRRRRLRKRKRKPGRRSSTNRRRRLEQDGPEIGELETGTDSEASIEHSQTSSSQLRRIPPSNTRTRAGYHTSSRNFDMNEDNEGVGEENDGDDDDYENRDEYPARIQPSNRNYPSNERSRSKQETSLEQSQSPSQIRNQDILIQPTTQSGKTRQNLPTENQHQTLPKSTEETIIKHEKATHPSSGYNPSTETYPEEMSPGTRFVESSKSIEEGELNQNMAPTAGGSSVIAQDKSHKFEEIQGPVQTSTVRTTAGTHPNQPLKRVQSSTVGMKQSSVPQGRTQSKPKGQVTRRVSQRTEGKSYNAHEERLQAQNSQTNRRKIEKSWVDGEPGERVSLTKETSDSFSSSTDKSLKEEAQESVVHTKEEEIIEDQNPRPALVRTSGRTFPARRRVQGSTTKRIKQQRSSAAQRSQSQKAHRKSQRTIKRKQVGGVQRSPSRINSQRLPSRVNSQRSSRGQVRQQLPTNKQGKSIQRPTTIKENLNPRRDRESYSLGEKNKNQTPVRVITLIEDSDQSATVTGSRGLASDDQSGIISEHSLPNRQSSSFDDSPPGKDSFEVVEGEGNDQIFPRTEPVSYNKHHLPIPGSEGALVETREETSQKSAVSTVKEEVVNERTWDEEEEEVEGWLEEKDWEDEDDEEEWYDDDWDDEDEEWDDEDGEWYDEDGEWDDEDGEWYDEDGEWDDGDGEWDDEDGEWDDEDGEWDDEDGEWDDEDEEWDDEDGEWDDEDGGWDDEDGEWDDEDGEWDDEDGEWDDEDGKWDDEDGEWDDEDGEWDDEDEEWDDEDGEWDDEDGEWDDEDEEWDDEDGEWDDEDDGEWEDDGEELEKEWIKGEDGREKWIKEKEWDYWEEDEMKQRMKEWEMEWEERKRLEWEKLWREAMRGRKRKAWEERCRREKWSEAEREGRWKDWEDEWDEKEEERKSVEWGERQKKMRVEEREKFDENEEEVVPEFDDHYDFKPEVTTTTTTTTIITKENPSFVREKPSKNVPEIQQASTTTETIISRESIAPGKSQSQSQPESIRREPESIKSQDVGESKTGIPTVERNDKKDIPSSASPSSRVTEVEVITSSSPNKQVIESRPTTTPTRGTITTTSQIKTNRKVLNDVPSKPPSSSGSKGKTTSQPQRSPAVKQLPGKSQPQDKRSRTIKSKPKNKSGPKQVVKATVKEKSIVPKDIPERTSQSSSSVIPFEQDKPKIQEENLPVQKSSKAVRQEITLNRNSPQRKTNQKPVTSTTRRRTSTVSHGKVQKSGRSTPKQTTTSSLTNRNSRNRPNSRTISKAPARKEPNRSYTQPNPQRSISSEREVSTSQKPSSNQGPTSVRTLQTPKHVETGPISVKVKGKTTQEQIKEGPVNKSDLKQIQPGPIKPNTDKVLVVQDNQESIKKGPDNLPCPKQEQTMKDMENESVPKPTSEQFHQMKNEAEEPVKNEPDNTSPTEHSTINRSLDSKSGPEQTHEEAQPVNKDEPPVIIPTAGSTKEPSIEADIPDVPSKQTPSKQQTEDQTPGEPAKTSGEASIVPAKTSGEPPIVPTKTQSSDDITGAAKQSPKQQISKDESSTPQVTNNNFESQLTINNDEPTGEDSLKSQKPISEDLLVVEELQPTKSSQKSQTVITKTVGKPGKGYTELGSQALNEEQIGEIGLKISEKRTSGRENGKEALSNKSIKKYSTNTIPTASHGRTPKVSSIPRVGQSSSHKQDKSVRIVASTISKGEKSFLKNQGKNLSDGRRRVEGALTTYTSQPSRGSSRIVDNQHYSSTGRKFEKSQGLSIRKSSGAAREQALRRSSKREKLRGRIGNQESVPSRAHLSYQDASQSSSKRLHDDLSSRSSQADLYQRIPARQSSSWNSLRGMDSGYSTYDDLYEDYDDFHPSTNQHSRTTSSPTNSLTNQYDALQSYSNPQTKWGFRKRNNEDYLSTPRFMDYLLDDDDESENDDHFDHSVGGPHNSQHHHHHPAYLIFEKPSKWGLRQRDDLHYRSSPRYSEYQPEFDESGLISTIGGQRDLREYTTYFDDNQDASQLSFKRLHDDLSSGSSQADLYQRILARQSSSWNLLRGVDSLRTKSLRRGLRGRNNIGVWSFLAYLNYLSKFNRHSLSIRNFFGSPFTKTSLFYSSTPYNKLQQPFLIIIYSPSGRFFFRFVDLFGSSFTQESSFFQNLLDRNLILLLLNRLKSYYRDQTIGWPTLTNSLLYNPYTLESNLELLNNIDNKHHALDLFYNNIGSPNVIPEFWHRNQYKPRLNSLDIPHADSDNNLFISGVNSPSGAVLFYKTISSPRKISDYRIRDQFFGQYIPNKRFLNHRDRLIGSDIDLQNREVNFSHGKDLLRRKSGSSHQVPVTDFVEKDRFFDDALPYYVTPEYPYSLKNPLINGVDNYPYKGDSFYSPYSLYGHLWHNNRLIVGDNLIYRIFGYNPFIPSDEPYIVEDIHYKWPTSSYKNEYFGVKNPPQSEKIPFYTRLNDNSYLLKLGSYQPFNIYPPYNKLYPINPEENYSLVNLIYGRRDGFNSVVNRFGARGDQSKIDKLFGERGSFYGLIDSPSTPSDSLYPIRRSTYNRGGTNCGQIVSNNDADNFSGRKYPPLPIFMQCDQPCISKCCSCEKNCIC